MRQSHDWFNLLSVGYTVGLHQVVQSTVGCSLVHKHCVSSLVWKPCKYVVNGGSDGQLF